jgi:Rrf2 family protein
VQLNQATDYAFRLVLHLAMLPEGEIVNGTTISEQEHIPPRFLLKIVRYLTKAGIVKSHRGVDGGFSLAAPPTDIALLDIIKAMEGPIAIHHCLEDREACSKHCTEECPVHEELADIQARLVDNLARVNFGFLADKYRSRRGKNG